MKDPHDGPRDIVKKKNVNLDLTSVEVFSRLIVSFDGTANVALPHTSRHQHVFSRIIGQEVTPWIATST